MGLRNRKVGGWGGEKTCKRSVIGHSGICTLTSGTSVMEVNVDDGSFLAGEDLGEG